MLAKTAKVDVVTDPHVGFFQAAEEPYECVLVSTGFAEFDPLRLCSQLRSLDRTRFVPIILLAEEGEDDRIVRGLELGINDYLIRPIDRQELTARLRTQVKRKRYNDHLRASVTQTIEMAVTDGLTGLHNRRYLDSHLQTLFDRAVTRRRPLSLMITDLDRFKTVNDTYGHDGGDEVLREFARRLRKNVRGIDLACSFRRRGVRRGDARHRGRDRREGGRAGARRNRRIALRYQRGGRPGDGQRRGVVAEAQHRFRRGPA